VQPTFGNGNPTSSWEHPALFQATKPDTSEVQWDLNLRFQCRRDRRELFESVFKILDDFLRQYLRVRESAAVLNAIILDPENIQAQFVTLE